MWIKDIVRKIIYKECSSSQAYISYMRSRGAKIGDRVTVFSPKTTNIDMTRPWLIDIGNDVQITEGVTLLTHGYDWAVLKGVYGEILGSGGGIQIGNNVFIGMKTTILKGVHVGNNVIIVANSLVNKDIPNNCVVAGNPARVIMPLDKYYEKRKAAQYQEAEELVRLYREHYGKEADESSLHEFFWLFTNGDTELPECWKKMMKLVGNAEYSYEKLRENNPPYENMNDFLKSVK